jgi:hypothetical protein
VTYAFIAFYCALLFGRSLYLGKPLTIPLHRLESGALLLFAFFMISDPKTTPDSRVGRVLFAALVAFGAWYVQFRLFRTNGLLWSLAACSMAAARFPSSVTTRAVSTSSTTVAMRRRTCAWRSSAMWYGGTLTSRHARTWPMGNPRRPTPTAVGPGHTSPHPTAGPANAPGP